MSTVLDTIAPLLLLIAIGFAAGAVPRIAKIEVGLNTFVLWFALPAFLFSTVTKAPLEQGVPAWFFIIAVAAPAATFVLAWLGLHLGEATRASARATALAASYGNVAYLGVPIVIGLFGPDAGLAAGLGQLMHNLLFMVGYPLLSGLLPGRAGEGYVAKTSVNPAFSITLGRQLTRAVVLNPIVGATLAGLAVNAVSVQIPAVIDEVINQLAGAAVPAALVAVGLALRPAMGGLRSGGAPTLPVAIATMAKTVVVPGLTILLIVTIGVDLSETPASVLVLMAATPTSTTAYLLASEHDSSGQLAAVAVFTTSVMAVVVLPLAVFITG